MKIYIASHNQYYAKKLANKLQKLGHHITSNWVFSPDFKPTECYSEGYRAQIAERDVIDVKHAQVLILISGNGRYSGGKFVEVGIALALDINVIVLGHRENMLMWHPKIRIAENHAELLTLLSKLETEEKTC